MKFVIKNPKENIVNLVRNLGYVLKAGGTEEFNCVRSIGNMGYPRFHVFIREDKDELVFNLHLDQKKPSYSGNRAHSGEHDGRVVEEEAERIKNILK